MKKKLRAILLVDDNPADNFYHRRVIESENVTDSIIIVEDGIEALEYLTNCPEENQPDLIFLDINMPRMNGWEFLDEYEKLEPQHKGHCIMMMLSTSDAIEDKLKATKYKYIRGYSSKPLTAKMLREVIEDNFADYL
ncbi:response regulator [Roseivirga seohaensis]|uniref:response regulator n=1 Tax=Roseivirga seohaensis TaxID=1914963 RepID=UPI003BAC98D2